jgi:hypothetical protein
VLKFLRRRRRRRRSDDPSRRLVGATSGKEH